MIGPGWLAGALAAAVLALAAYAAGRLVAAGRGGRRSERDVDAFHVAMGISMAAMLTGSLSAFDAEAWAVVFACATVWFALRLPWHDAVRAAETEPVGHRLAHVVSSGSMVYMLLAMPGGSMAGMGPGGGGPVRLPGLAAVLALGMLAAAGAHADRAFLRARRRAPAAVVLAVAADGGSVALPGGDALLAPRTAAGAEVAMNLAMAAMLALMAWR